MIKLIGFLWLLAIGFLPTVTVAGTVELFLLKEHEGQIENLALASEEGHQIVYYYLDAELAIESKLTDEVSQPLERLFQSVVQGLSKDELAALGEDGVTAEVMKLIATDLEFQQQAEIMKSVSNDPDIKAGLIKVEKDKQQAQKRGVVMEDLPAIFFMNEKFTKVTDFSNVADSVVSE